MKNDNNQDASQHPKSIKDNQKEEIPLWLQGLEKHEDEDTSPFEVEEASVDNWVRELPDESQKISASKTEESTNTVNESLPGKETYPDWLSEMSEIDPAKPPVLDLGDEKFSSEQIEEVKESLIQGEEPDELEIKHIPSEQIPDEVDDSFEDLPPVEKEIELTEPGKKEISASIDESMPEESSQDEDLPPWLQEMIAESPETSTIQKPLDAERFQEAEEEFTDEPTEPVVLSEQHLVREGTVTPEDETEGKIDKEVDAEEEEASSVEEGVEGVEEVTDEEVLSREKEIEVDEEEPSITEDEVTEEEVSAAEEQFISEEGEISSTQHEDDFAAFLAGIEEKKEEFLEVENAGVIESGLFPEQSPSEWIPENIVVDNLGADEVPHLHEEPASTIEGDTRPIEVTETTTGDEEQQAEEPYSEAHQEHPEQLEEDSVAPYQEDEESLTEAAQGEPEQELEAHEELPEDLADAKDALIKGDTDKAVRLIGESEHTSSYLQEIQSWLMDSANKVEKPNVDFWELMGDIALKNNEADLALDAYAKAIQTLISEEANDEID